MLDLTIDPPLLSQAPWGAELRRQVARMVTAAARSEAKLAAEPPLSIERGLSRPLWPGKARPFTPPRVASIERGLSRPLWPGKARPFTPPRVASIEPRSAERAEVLDLEVSLRLTDDPTIRELNREFRHKDKATDVLAFAQREGPWAGVGPQLLGDIVISLPTARRQAKRKTAAGVFTEVRFLASHGLCHLLGYDHNDDEEERVMNARMAALLEQAGGRGPIRAA
jgi:probable rRNA maturation factor